MIKNKYFFGQQTKDSSDSIRYNSQINSNTFLNLKSIIRVLTLKPLHKITISGKNKWNKMAKLSQTC